MKLTVRHLRRLICEVLEQRDKLDVTVSDTYFTVAVSHAKTFHLNDGSTYVVPHYETSELRCQIKKNEGELVLVNIYVPESQRGRGIARKMIDVARKFAFEHDLQVFTSGVYSSDGKALVQSLKAKGEAEDSHTRHKLS